MAQNLSLRESHSGTTNSTDLHKHHPTHSTLSSSDTAPTTPTPDTEVPVVPQTELPQAGEHTSNAGFIGLRIFAAFVGFFKRRKRRLSGAIKWFPIKTRFYLGFYFRSVFLHNMLFGGTCCNLDSLP